MKATMKMRAMQDGSTGRGQGESAEMSKSREAEKGPEVKRTEEELETETVPRSLWVWRLEVHSSTGKDGDMAEFSILANLDRTGTFDKGS